MSIRAARLVSPALILSLALALLALGTMTSASVASASACGKWGKTNPEKLSNGQARKAILCLINKQRDQAGLGDLDRHKKLQKAAQRHNGRMHGTGCFSHECPGEPAIDSRLERVGYLGGGLSRWAYGENVAWGMRENGTPSSIVKAWMGSPGHRANILSRDFEDIGIGFDSGSPSSKRAPGGIYTTDFGLRRG